MVQRSADVAIIGGGLVGCFAAYFLRRRGQSVVVIERGAVCTAASGTNFGNLRLQGRHPAEFALALRAQAIWEELAALSGEGRAIRASGHLYLGLAVSDQPKLESIAQEANAAGLAVDLLDGNAVRRRWPMVSDLITGACWSRRDGIAEPTRIGPTVARLAAAAGAQLIENTRVTRMVPGAGGFTVSTDRDLSVSCGRLINAAGAWGAELAGACGEPVPLFAAGPPLFEVHPEHAWDGPSLAAVDGTLLLRPGLTGPAVAGTFPRVKADLGSGRAPVPPERVGPALAHLNSVVPGLGRLRAGRVWSGVEGYLPDMLPVIGASGTTPGLVHAFGFSGHGFQLAPGVGAVLAELVTTGVSETPIAAFALARFADGAAVVDDKLWREFDPELVARFRRGHAGTADASRHDL
ncbi:MAG TPA: FAD-dependent oxidoreductase [Hyphomicrobiaceae bacterium]|jgi:sarcosine oxidase subunit beta|nr:FAD-dependent oxidoreductase [Hyphomicrobiaceae bacterium]